MDKPDIDEQGLETVQRIILSSRGASNSGNCNDHEYAVTVLATEIDKLLNRIYKLEKELRSKEPNHGQ